MQFRRLFRSRVVCMAWYYYKCKCTICFALFLFIRFLLLLLLLFVYFTFNVFQFRSCYLSSVSMYKQHWSVWMFVFYKFILYEQWTLNAEQTIWRTCTVYYLQSSTTNRRVCVRELLVFISFSLNRLFNEQFSHLIDFFCAIYNDSH